MSKTASSMFLGHKVGGGKRPLTSRTTPSTRMRARLSSWLSHKTRFTTGSRNSTPISGKNKKTNIMFVSVEFAFLPTRPRLQGVQREWEAPTILYVVVEVATLCELLVNIGKEGFHISLGETPGRNLVCSPFPHPCRIYALSFTPLLLLPV